MCIKYPLSVSELGLAVSLHSWRTEQRTAQDYSPHLSQAWAWDKLCLTCAGFCWWYKHTDCRICSTDANIWLNESHTGKAPDNASGPRIMACTFEGLVTGLFPAEMFRLISSLLEFRLPGHGEVLRLSTHVICPSWKTGVSWEEVERCESALLVFSATTDSFQTASQQRGFDTGYGLPARKWAQNVSLKMTAPFQHLNCVIFYVIYKKQLAVKLVLLNASSYICRIHQKTVVSIGI